MKDGNGHGPWTGTTKGMRWRVEHEAVFLARSRLYAPWSNSVSPLVFIGQVLTSGSFVFSPRGVVVQEGLNREVRVSWQEREHGVLREELPKARRTEPPLPCVSRSRLPLNEFHGCPRTIHCYYYQCQQII